MPLTVIPAQAGIQYCQGQADAIKAGSPDAGFRRYDDASPANPCKCNFQFGFSLAAVHRYRLSEPPSQRKYPAGIAAGSAIYGRTLKRRPAISPCPTQGTDRLLPYRGVRSLRQVWHGEELWPRYVSRRDIPRLSLPPAEASRQPPQWKAAREARNCSRCSCHCCCRVMVSRYTTWPTWYPISMKPFPQSRRRGGR